MSWLCLNCETVNFDAESRCIVCGEERYYSASEVRKLLDNHPEAKSLHEQVKKLTTQNKWLQTRNKNLTQENKRLQNELEYKNLTSQEKETLFTEMLSSEKNDDNTTALQNQLREVEKNYKTKVLIWQISTLVAACAAIFLFIYRG